MARSLADLRAALLSRDLGWDWQHAEMGWRSGIYFASDTKGKIAMVGETYLVGCDAMPAGNRDAIVQWESSEPFAVPANAESVTIKTRRNWTKAAASGIDRTTLSAWRASSEMQGARRLVSRLGGQV